MVVKFVVFVVLVVNIDYIVVNVVIYHLNLINTKINTKRCKGKRFSQVR